MKIRPPQVQPLQPAPRSEHTFFRRLIMTHNNKLAQASERANTQPRCACAPFLRAAIEVSNTQTYHVALTILAQAIKKSNTQTACACALFFGMAVSTTRTLHMVAMPTILAAADDASNTQTAIVAAPALGLHRRPSGYPPRRRVGHHKSCGNTIERANTLGPRVSALILGVSHFSLEYPS